METKERISAVQSIVSIAAILVGGWWTYDNFVKERKNLPHATIEHLVSHIPLTNDVNLLRVALMVTNSGSSRLEIKSSDLRIQQIVPVICVDNSPCANDQIVESLQAAERKEDRFTWPLIGRRNAAWKTAIAVEPGEKEQMEFEFAIPSKVKVVRIYSYIPNESSGPSTTALGWHLSTYYDLTGK